MYWNVGIGSGVDFELHQKSQTYHSSRCFISLDFKERKSSAKKKENPANGFDLDGIAGAGNSSCVEGLTLSPQNMKVFRLWGGAETCFCTRKLSQRESRYKIE